MSYPIPSTLFSSELTVLQEEVMIYEVVDRMPEGSLRGRNPSKLPKNNGTSKTCFTTWWLNMYIVGYHWQGTIEYVFF